MASKKERPTCRLVAVDGNGTLLGADGSSVSDFTREVIQRLESSGIPVVLATARPLEKAKLTVKQVGMKHYVVPENGARAVRLEDDKALYELWIDGQDSAQPLRRVREALHGRCFFAQLTADGGLIQEDHPWLQEEIMKADALKFFRTPVQDLVLALVEGMQCAKTYLHVADTPDFAACLAEVKVAAGDGWEVREIKQGPFPGIVNTCEIQSSRVNKADGLRGLCESVGISIGNVWAFGDDSNDLRMLSEMGWGVRMANHQPDLAGIGDDVTTFSNAEDGVAKYLQEHLLAGSGC